MELMGIGIQNIGNFSAFYRTGLRATRRFGSRASIQPAFTGSIINSNTGLRIVAINIKENAFPIILYRFGLHVNAAGHQIISFKNRCDTIQNMVPGFFYVVGNHIFKGKHPLHVQIAGTCDQVVFIGIFCCKLIADQVAAVV